MSLFEWFGESYNPGDMGGIRVESGGGSDQSRGLILLCFVIAVALIAGGAFAIFHFGGNLWKQKMLLIGSGFAVCLLLAYFLRPEPDLDNIGWLGGLIDHPFRYSDDINRILLFLQIALLPGRFIAQSIVNFFVLLSHFNS